MQTTLTYKDLVMRYGETMAFDLLVIIEKMANVRDGLIEMDEEARCLVPTFDGADFVSSWKDALWDKFYTGAPQRQRRCVERYKIVKRA